MEQENLVKVLLPRMLPQAFTYAVPEEIEVKSGDFVLVPLGNNVIYGVVWGVATEDIKSSKIKKIISRADSPSLKKPLRKFITWVADYTLSPPGSVLKMAMSVTEALKPEAVIEAYELVAIPNIKLTPSRQKIVDLLQESSPLTIKEIMERAEVGRSVIKGLAEKKIIKIVHISNKPIKPIIRPMDIKFSNIQKSAADNLRQKVQAKEYSVTLLDGVTGSGKTEVYFAAVEEVLKEEGGQILIMLPEIALTSQVVARFKDKFGFEPVQWHSNMTKSQKTKYWRDIANGHARLVIGARSALFLPFDNLRTIIVDEEHDASYKQEDGVIYHARDMAVVRANIENIPIILASATPSIETVENVKSGKYSVLKLPSRHGGAVMPDIKIVDMRKQKLKAGLWLSSDLKQSLAANMEVGQQSMLFLNRRGYAPLTLCRSCGYRFKCVDCSSWLVEHRNKKQLLCHHCGHFEPIPKECPECEKEDVLVSCGPGVERVAEEVASNFPDAKVSLMTSDKITAANGQGMIDEIMDGSVDIIVGTQIIAKGHHFPRLTLVGVIDADIGLEGGDLRASERTYQLLQQVSGRAGREQEKGRVVIQSYMPDNMLMKALAANDRDAFVESEVQSRSRTNMPPYVRLAGIIISGVNEVEVMKAAKFIVRAAPVHDGINVLGPVPAPLHLLRGKYRYRILIRTPRNVNIQNWIKNLLQSVKIAGNIKVKVDVDPYSFM